MKSLQNSLALMSLLSKAESQTCNNVEVRVYFVCFCGKKRKENNRLQFLLEKPLFSTVDPVVDK